MTKALAKVAKAAGHADLKAAVEAHLAEIKQQIFVLKKDLEAIGEKPEGAKCDAIEGLIEKTEGLVKETIGFTLDAALMGACAPTFTAEGQDRVPLGLLVSCNAQAS